MDWFKLKDAKIVPLPYKAETIFYRNPQNYLPMEVLPPAWGGFDMATQIEKQIVPPREERLENIGDPKAPQVGKITPKTIALPPVDDLLGQMKKISTDMALKHRLEAEMMWNRRVEENTAFCNINCKCPPCLEGQCHYCFVESRRDGDRDVVRTAAMQYRGTVYE